MKGRSLVLLLSVIVVAAIVVLASSLHNVTFRPGRAFSAAAQSSTAVLLPLLQLATATPLWKLLVLWLAFVVNLILFFYLLSAPLRKKIVRQMLSLASGFLILMLALRYQVLKIPELMAETAKPGSGGQPGAEPGASFPIFHRPPMAAWTAYLASLAVLLGIFALGYFAYRSWKRSRPRRPSSLTAIASIAEASLRNLASGRDWGDVIIASYAQMSEALSARRGIRRGGSATAREFADRLLRAGLPAAAVEGLTRLFETVRYGGRRASESDQRAAIDCLNAILLACGATR